MLAFRDKENVLQFIPLDGGQLTTLPCPSPASCAFSPDQRWLVTGDTARHILLWDLLTSQWSTLSIPVQVPIKNKSHYGPSPEDIDFSNETATDFQFTPDGQRLVFGVSSDEGYVHICHFDPVQKRITLEGTLPNIHFEELKMAPNGGMLAMAHHEGVYVYDLTSRQLLRKFPQTTKAFYDRLAFSPDSQFLMSSKDDGTVDIWSLATFECVVCLAAHPGLVSYWTNPIGGLDWSSTGYIATGEPDLLRMI